jgi:cysteine-rich repeat protein
MSRVTISLLELLLLVPATLGGCSVEGAVPDLQSNAYALSAAGAPATSSAVRACVPGSRWKTCPPGESCQASHGLWGHCVPTSANACGNGSIEAGEACDDGNRTDADGCSSMCQLDDNASTPGDDRAHYFQCVIDSNTRLTCGPGTECCLSASGSGCVPAGTCMGRLQAMCDGPEDCASGNACLTGKASGCASPDQLSGVYYSAACHTSLDCTGALCRPPSSMPQPCPVCDAGLCVAN